jgi:hypothetical protein
MRATLAIAGQPRAYGPPDSEPDICLVDRRPAIMAL